MEIIRVQHRIDGNGIFNSRTKSGKARASMMVDWEILQKRHLDLFPPPYDDILIKRFPLREEFCAFKSINQFQEWVNKDEIAELIRLGFNVLLLDVSTCVIGEYQILFKKKNVIKTKDITHLFL